jgi:DNA-binding PadR family transcriptional regulator
VSTSFVLLGLLVRGPRHGYELKREHDARLPGTRPIAFGQVYATLGRLTRDGLIQEADQEQEAGPERTTFRLTEQGRASLVQWLSKVEEPAPFVQSTLLAKVVVALFGADNAGDARRYLAAQRAAHLERMRELTKTKNHGTIGEVVAADYAIQHLDADLRWMQTTLERVEQLHREVAHG